jgi:hypothetical protein
MRSAISRSALPPAICSSSCQRPPRERCDGSRGHAPRAAIRSDERHATPPWSSAEASRHPNLSIIQPFVRPAGGRSNVGTRLSSRQLPRSTMATACRSGKGMKPLAGARDAPLLTGSSTVAPARSDWSINATASAEVRCRHAAPEGATNHSPSGALARPRPLDRRREPGEPTP